MSPAQLEFLPAMASIYALSIYGFMLILSKFIIRLDLFGKSLTKPSGRYGSLDGLRGLLATGVFLHHTFSAYGYFALGQWQWSSSAVFNHLGQTTVALFFMITGFLFTLKASSPTVHWKSLYLSRVARLVPLYALVVLLVFMVIFYLSDWEIKESPWAILKEFFIWITFACFGRPDINAYPMSWTLMANVNWSLKYEVIFYLFAVPVIHWMSRLISARTGLLASFGMIVAVLLFRWYRGGEGGVSLYTVQFLGGMMVAYAFRIDEIKTTVIESQGMRWLAVVATVSLLFMQYAYSPVAVISNIIMFTAVTGGASLFGLFKHKSAIWLGDISYGIYLLHGLVLWVVLSNLGKAGILVQLDVFQYWLIMLGTAAVIVLLASCSYVFLEKPVMDLLKAKKKKGSLPTQKVSQIGGGGSFVTGETSR